MAQANHSSAGGNNKQFPSVSLKNTDSNRYGGGIRIETRWTKFDPEETRKYAAELVALAPDVILASGTSTVGPLLRLTRTVPIVFPLAADPVAAGLVESLARPGGNATGFMSFETGISAKWLEL